MKRRLQVFISSTFTDLVAERQAAVSAILKAGHIPAGMELFTAGDRSQMDTIKQWIDESDVYMLILGGRYGSIEPISGISYTELEYDYAVQQERPLFAVVINEGALEDRVKIEGSVVLERSHPSELALFRAKVLGNISSFFDDKKDIKLCVYETLAEFGSNRTLKGWVRADEVVDTKPLVEELRRLDEVCRTLQEENRQLKAAAETQVNAKPSASSTKAESFQELKRILQAINIDIPAEVTGGSKGFKRDLLSIFYTNRETLINGVVNRVGISPVQSFFYYNILPKLEVHGLAASEKIAGVQYRRYAVTPLGNEFLAAFEKEMLLNPAASASESPEAEAAPPFAKAATKKMGARVRPSE
jgi:hypothetical protein